ncbi:sirohydrochlorin chelatase [Streptomyces tubbatahanensis]|uniref:Sirohydrochlorin chelatase n=1 Tax=Streptomyces tubbatahanensis TaxID=2923272 RepID=A0ABY3XYE2_9ACTN|nr:sirohydrochlorin chelatase [Streptomyces tubbatahanensis]UNS99569.1 sirohydrochlorin chelatase [Streptomyces tubbatahanensis]
MSLSRATPLTPASPALLLIAHGSRDPRHAATVAALTARVRRRAPGLRVAVGYLDFDTPSVGTALRSLHAAGARQVVAVPLLLTRAFHAKTDIPGVLAEESAPLAGLTVRQADVLGPHHALTVALERRLRAAGVAPGDAPHTGVVLAAAGSSDPEASAVIAAIAREWRRTTGWCAVRPAFASASAPRTADAVRDLRAAGARRVAVAPYVLAPGRLPDRIAAGAREAGADALAPVLGPAPEVARVVLERYAAALAPALTASAA